MEAMPSALSTDEADCEFLFKLISSSETEEVSGRKLIELINNYRDSSLNLKEFFSPEARKEKTTPTEIPADADKFTQVVMKLQADKNNQLKSFFKTLIDNCPNINEGIDIDVFNEAVEATFRKLLSKEERNVLKSGVDKDFNARIDLSEILTSIKQGIVDKKDKILIHFYFKAIVLDKLQTPTNDYFEKYKIVDGQEYSFKEIQTGLCSSLEMSPEDAKDAYQILSDGSAKLQGKDVLAMVDSYRTQAPKPLPIKQKEKPLTDFKETKKPAAETRPEIPALKGTELIEKFKSLLRAKKMSFVHVYRMAQEEEDGWTTVISLIKIINEVIPEFGKHNTVELVKMFDTSQDGCVTKDEYDVILMKTKDDLNEIEAEDSRIELDKASSVMQASALSRSASLAESLVVSQHGLEEGQSAAAKVRAALAKSGMTPEQAFRYIDDDNTGDMTAHMVFKGLVELCPNLSRKELVAFLRFADALEHGDLTRGEFLAAVTPELKKELESKPGVVDKPKETPAKKPEKPATPTPISKPGAKPAPLPKTPSGSVSSGSRKSIQVVEPKIKEKHDIKPKPSTSGPLSESGFYNLIRDLKSALIKNQVDLQELFSSTQRRGDDSESEGIPVLVLFKKLSQKLPDFPYQDLLRIIKYADTKGTGLVEKSEFELLIGYNEKEDRIEESRLLQKGVNANNVTKLKKQLQMEGIDPNGLFFDCDTDNDGWINILDMKQTLEKLMEKTEPNQKLIVAFVKEAKTIFKTYSIDEKSFALFLNTPEAVKDYHSFRKQINDIQTGNQTDQRELQTAIGKLKDIMKVKSKGKSAIAVRSDDTAHETVRS